MPNTIYVVRHGQDQDNADGILNGHRDSQLTELGRQQAEQTAGRLKDVKIEIIYTSPLRRAYDTARIIADELKVDEIITDHHLIERDFGVLTGKAQADIPKYATELLQTEGVNYFLNGGGVESMPATYQRAQTILNEITKRHPDNTILIVTHGDLGQLIRGAYYGWAWQESLLKPHFGNADILKLSHV